MEAQVKTPWMHLGLCVAAGVVFRIVAAFLTFRGNFDSTTVGLMALDILAGERPLFFYGQNYMGALEAYLAAFYIQLFGANLTALALSPITFTAGWILLSYFFMRDLIHPKAGLCAAWVIAIPGWTITWYTINTYGGYPTFCMFGTLCAWLSVRLDHFPMRFSKQLTHIMIIGCSAGLALWSNFQSGVYLAFALIFLVRFMHREKWAWRFWLAGAAGFLAFLVGFFPVILEWNTTTGGHVAELKVTGELIAANFGDLTGRHLRPLAFGVSKEYPLVYLILRMLVWGVAFFSAGFSIYKAQRFWPLLAPLVFIAIFLLLYLPHPLAAEGAVRYLMSFWVMVTLLLFALPAMNLRYARWVLLAWIGLNLAEAGISWKNGHGLKQKALAERAGVIKVANELPGDTVNMVGGYIFGHYGQTFAWSATNKIEFISAFDERRQGRAQAAELAQPQLLACTSGDFYRLRHTFNAIGVRSKRVQAAPVSFFSNVHVTAPEHVHVPFSAWTLEGAPIPALNDRQYPTEHSGQPDEGFILDLVDQVTPGRIWLSGTGPYQHKLPDSLAIYASTNETDWTMIYEADQRFKVAYSIENQVYAKGFFGLMECVPHLAKANRLKFVCRGPGDDGQTWAISEVFVQAYAGRMRPTGEEEIETIRSWMKEAHIEFLATDRWLSAKFFGNGVFEVYPRYNSKFRATQGSRVLHPRPTLALAVRNGMLAETKKMFHPLEIREVRQTAHYAVIFFAEAEAKEQRIWNGHAVLRNEGPEPKWH